MKKITAEQKNIYFIGIEGAGTSALAVMYKKLGYDVMGSDNGDHFYADSLNENGIKVLGKYDKKNIPKNINAIVYSTSIKENNPEYKEAVRRKLQMKSYPEALAEVFNKKIGIAVCGTHGKTTTTAMLAHVLSKLQLNPSAVVGSKVIDWKGNSLTGEGEYFVIEADEYQNKLKHYMPWSVILTSVDYDHPDFFKTPGEYKKAFRDFVKKIPKHGNLFYCNDTRDVVDVTAEVSCHKYGYGFTEGSDYAIKIKQNKLLQIFEVFYAEESLGDFSIKLPGRHNALNATSVIAFCHKLGFDLEEVRKTLASFRGTARRFERVGKRNGTVLIDDYAHHPEEVKATLRAAKEIFSKKNIITVFHPHSFTRTEALLEDFAHSFADTNKLIVLDIYGSARESSGKVSSLDLVNLINKYSPRKAEYIPKIEDAVKFLKESAEKNDLIISMGAGDVWQVTHKLAK